MQGEIFSCYSIIVACLNHRTASVANSQVSSKGRALVNNCKTASGFVPVLMGW